MKSTLKVKFKKGYTALELLISMSIIGILASILLPAISSSQRKANYAKAKAMINSMSMALDSYRATFGAYPNDGLVGIDQTAVTQSSQSIYFSTGTVFVAGVNSPNQISDGPFMEFKSKDLSTTGFNEDMDGDGAKDDTVYMILDPWGSAYVYEQPGTNNTNSFDIYSVGPDGANGTSDDLDLNNWS